MDKGSYYWSGGKASESIVFSKVTAAHDESLSLWAIPKAHTFFYSWDSELFGQQMSKCPQRSRIISESLKDNTRVQEGENLLQNIITR